MREILWNAFEAFIFGVTISVTMAVSYGLIAAGYWLIVWLCN